MKLDKRLKISPFNCFDAKRARRYIDNMGYFSNNLGDFSDLTKCKFGTLGSIHDDTEHPYYMKENVTFNGFNGFFVPELNLPSITKDLLECRNSKIIYLK